MTILKMAVSTFLHAECLTCMKPSFWKRIVLIRLLFGLMILLPVGIKAQSAHPILSRFSAATYSNTIRLSWAILAGNTCLGTIIQRSSDGVFFETIGEIAGICGSPDVEIQYVFTDETPLLNQMNYYRLELGSQGFSSAIAIEYFPLNSLGYSLRYDKTTSTAHIHFENPTRAEFEYQLFSINGKLILQRKTNENRLEISTVGLAQQIYILRISNAGRSFELKIAAF
jgi:hypothetical protein